MIKGIHELSLVMFSAFAVAIISASFFIKNTNEDEKSKNLVYACTIIYLIIYLIICIVKYSSI